MPDIGYLLMSLTKKMRTELNRSLADVDNDGGITAAQWAIVAALARSGKSVTAAELSNELDMDKPTVSGVVRRLMAKKLLVVKPKPQDRRARQLSLSEDGMRVFHECEKVANRTVEEFLKPLDNAERLQLRDLLESLEKDDSND